MLIKVEVTGICGTDIKIFDDQFTYHPPVIIGHEFSGIIVKTGEGVKNRAVGDRVVSEHHTGACGLCRYCLTGRRHLCPDKRVPGMFSSESGIVAYVVPTWPFSAGI